MQLHLDITPVPYHLKLNQTKPNLTIPNQTKFSYIGHNTVVFQNRISKFCMELHIDNIHLPYHSKPNQNSLNHTIPNQNNPNILKSCITPELTIVLLLLAAPRLPIIFRCRILQRWHLNVQNRPGVAVCVSNFEARSINI